MADDRFIDRWEEYAGVLGLGPESDELTFWELEQRYKGHVRLVHRYNNKLLAAAGVGADLLVSDPFPDASQNKPRPFQSLVDTWQGPREKAQPIPPTSLNPSPETSHGE